MFLVKNLHFKAKTYCKLQKYHYYVSCFSLLIINIFINVFDYLYSYYSYCKFGTDYVFGVFET